MFAKSSVTLPQSILEQIVPTLDALNGKWVEIDKPADQVLQILARLSIGGVRRRLVARAACEMDLQLLEPSIMAESESAPSTQPSSPVKAHQGDQNGKKVENDLIYTRWLQRQYFPMGKIREAEFVADGKTVNYQEDPDTGAWVHQAEWKDGVLIQRRESEKLGLIMIEIRCALKKRVSLNENEMFDSETHDEDEPLYQWFRWIIEDREKDEQLICTYYLRRIGD